MAGRLSLVAAAAGLALAAPLAAQDIEVPFEEFTLDNGLHVILHRDASTPTITTNVWYHVGSAHERPGRTGFAHFFEHLMFEGSANVPRGMIDQWFEEVGGSPNGSTTRDRTNYHQTFSSNALDMALFIESDRMAYLMEAMSPELIDIQRAVVQNERRQNYDNRPYGLAFQTLAEEMYAADHPYSWPVIGYMDDLQAATFEDVGEFFGQYYAPNNASLVIAGDIDYDEAQELVTKWFSEIPAGEPVPPLSGREVRLEGTTRVMLEDRVQLPRLYLAWVSPAAYEAGDAEMTALAQVLAGGRNSRLYRRLVYEMEIADDVSAFQRSGKLNSDFVVTATARSGYTLEELETVVLEEIERLRTEPPTPAELDRVRNQYEMAFLEQIERVDRKADQLNEYLFYVGDPGYFAEDLARFRTLTPAALRGAAARYLDPQARVILSIVPQGGAELAIPGSRLVPSENLQNSPAAR
jgi:zinc protease